jgi:hypothetical protein
MGASLPPYRWASADSLVAAAKEAFSDNDFSLVWKGGEEMTPDQAVALAVN